MNIQNENSHQWIQNYDLKYKFKTDYDRFFSAKVVDTSIGPENFLVLYQASLIQKLTLFT